MTRQPKIGILFITSGWFRDVGLQGESMPFTEEVEAIGREIVARISAFAEPVYHGVIYSTKEAEAAARKINAAEVDGLLIAPLMWCEDQILRAALKLLPRMPILVCTFFPTSTLPEYLEFHGMLKGSGSVGTLQMSGLLAREEFTYRSLTGWYRDDSLYDEIRTTCRAFAIIRRLKRAKCGILPFRCDYMSTTYVDEFTIRKRYGIECDYLEIQSFYETAQTISVDEIAAFQHDLGTAGHVVEVEEKSLVEGIKYALAMEKILSERGIDILAMNDIIDEMHRVFGLRPCLVNPRLSATGVVVAMEADIAAAIAMYILRLFTGEVPFYTEVFTADLDKNTLLLGHAGYHDPVNRDPSYPVRIIPDVEYQNTDPYGACTYFKFKPGPVTVVNSVYNGERLRWVVFEGESLPGPPLLEGNCHLHARIDLPVREFYRRMISIGVSQHCIVIPGHHLQSMAMLGDLLDIEFCELA